VGTYSGRRFQERRHASPDHPPDPQEIIRK
jgi:hypothetical protein